MKLYIAGRYPRRDELKGYAKDHLEALGHRVTSRWLDESYDPKVHMKDLSEDERVVLAKQDLDDIDACRALIAFSADEPTPRGGRHVEFGYALAKGKFLIVIGPVENIFMALPQVLVFPTWGRFLRLLMLVDEAKASQETG